MDNFVLCAAESGGIDWGRVWSTVFTGLVVVFLILGILVLFLFALGKIFQAIDKSRRTVKPAKQGQTQQQAKPAQSAPPVKPSREPVSVPAEEEEITDDLELIAVITAAVAAFGEAEGKQYRVTGIKRSRTQRSGWSAAGIAENTRGFGM